MKSIKIFILLSLISHSLLFAGEKHLYATVFASSNLKFVLPQILEKFYEKYPDSSVHVQYGASGELVEDILSGDRWDLFFSADMKYAQEIFDKGYALEDVKVYAKGEIALLLPLEFWHKDFSLDLLLEKKIPNIAIANRKLAPYGRASLEVLHSLGVYEKLKDKLRYTPDVATVINSVVWSKNVGFVPSSALQIIKKRHYKQKLKAVEIPKNLYKPILQGYVSSKTFSQNRHALVFMQFLHSKEIEDIFLQSGYKSMLPASP